MTKNRNKILSFDEHVKKYRLDEEEAELLRSVEAGEWESVPDLEKRKKELKEAMEYTLELRKTKNVNFRIKGQVLMKLKEKAQEKGIPYQTLLSALVHQYVNGQIQVSL